jgi:archaellum component FlaF (FlaF/FlaG flagellin family)
MSTLYVYTTEGTCLHPSDGSDDPSINRYFESVNFVVDLKSEQSPSIEAYFRATLPSGRPEQLFLRFQGEDPETLFADCGAAITRELVEDRGWDIQQTEDKGDPSMLLQRTVLQQPDDPTQLVNVDPFIERLDGIRAVLRNGQQLELTGRNYATIAVGILLFADQPISIAVPDGDVSVSDAEMVFYRKSQKQGLAFTRESLQIVESADSTTEPTPESVDSLGALGQTAGGDLSSATSSGATDTTTSEERLIEPEIEEIEARLQRIKDKDVSQSTVRAKLDDAISGVYPDLSVGAGSESLNRSATGTGSSDPEPVSGPSQQGQGNTLLPDVSTPVLGAVIAIAIIVLLFVVFAPFDSDSSSEGFKIEDVSAVNTTAGETLSIDVTLAATGNGSVTEEIEVTAGSLGSWSGNRTLEGGKMTNVKATFDTTAGDAGKYTINASNGGETMDETVWITDPIEVTDVETHAKEDPVNEGNDIAINVTLRNNGAGEANPTVNVTAESRDSEESLDPEKQEVKISADENNTVNLNIPTDDGDAGEYDIGVSIDGNEADESATAVVRQPAYFQVSIENEDGPIKVDAGDPIELDIEITNTGGQIGTQSSRTRIKVKDGELFKKSQSDEISIQSDETVKRSVTFNTSPAQEQVKKYVVNVSSANNTAERELVIRNAPYFEVEVINTSVSESSVDVHVNITNKGTTSGKPQQFEVNGDNLTFGLVKPNPLPEIEPGKNQTVIYSASVENTESDTDKVTVSSEDDQATIDVNIDGSSEIIEAAPLTQNQRGNWRVRAP